MDIVGFRGEYDSKVGTQFTIASPANTGVQREALLRRRGLRLEWLTVGWNVVEGVVAVLAAVSARSVALLGFGIDSFVESASGIVLIWRLLAERGSDVERVERIERRAEQLVAASLFGLAIYIALEACLRLIGRERPEVSKIGIAVTALSIGVMWWLRRAKRETAHALRSRALHADASQTSACLWLSFVTLAGIGLNAAFGWWWADPVAALLLVYFIIVEAREAWQPPRTLHFGPEGGAARVAVEPCGAPGRRFLSALVESAI